jgi:hemerythrin-like domain-containing protein
MEDMNMNTYKLTPSQSPLHWTARSLTMAALILSFATSHAMAQTEAELNPTDVLRKEHEIIRKMADAAKEDAKKIQKHGEVDSKRIAKFHDFFTNFADRCHHAKEEDELFPVLREMKVDPVVIDLLVKQHEEGRILLAGIEGILKKPAEGGGEPDTQALGRYIYEYAQLMDRHISLENEYLWPQAAERLDDSQKEDIAKAFHKIETEDLGKGFHQKYHALAMELLGKESQP